MNDRIEQIRRSHKSARPKQSNPAWVNTHNDLGVALHEIERLKARNELLEPVYEAAQDLDATFYIKESFEGEIVDRFFATLNAVQTKQGPRCKKHAVVDCLDCAVECLKALDAMAKPADSRHDYGERCPHGRVMGTCDECRNDASVGEGQEPRGLPMERRLESKCEHEMETSGSGTYCLKPDCDVNWT